MATLQKGVDPLIARLIGVYYAVGIWDNGNRSKFREYLRISVFVFCSLCYPLTLVGGGLENDVLSDAIFLLTLGLAVMVLEFKGVWVFFNQENILNLINATCVQFPNDKELKDRVNVKSNILRTCCKTFVCLVLNLGVAITGVSSPLIFQSLPYKIWFPFDYKTSRIAHWGAHFFVFICEIYVCLLSFLSSIMWYIMLNFSFHYDILGYRFKILGVGSTSENPTNANPTNANPMNANPTNMPNRNSFENEMIECIQFHKQLDNNVNSVANLFSALFFAQIGTSGLCICGSLYILAVDSSSGLYTICIGLLFYSTIDIFIVMYLGNEIKVSSARLPYCLFESNWTGQTETCKRAMIILTEVLKRHKLIMVAKLYALSLETFNSIMRSAYSMFNILRSM